MTKELTVILKDHERSYREKFLVYNDLSMDANDPEIESAIAKAKENFRGEPEDIQVRVLMVVK